MAASNSSSSSVLLSMSSSTPHRMLLSLIIVSSFLLTFVTSFEFQVGDRFGWVVPPSNDTKLYNDWASEKRFKVGDAIRFKYRKDSVMEVSEPEYKRCNSTHPIFFSNTGNSIFSLERSGYFYFISGAAGHCDKGQRMIVKVMGHDQDSPAASSSAGPAGKSVATFIRVLLPIAALHSLFLRRNHMISST